MKARFRLVRLSHRGGKFYCYDTRDKTRESLGTTDKAEAQRLLHAKNEACRAAAMNLQLAQIYLQHSDPAMAARTWQKVMDQMTPLKTGATQRRHIAAMRDEAFDLIRERKLIETTSEHFFSVLAAGTISTNVFLRRLHNFAVNMHWLPWPIIPKPEWPKVVHKEKRAITALEHQMIVAREHNPEIRAYYQVLWHIGAAQTDVAELTAGDIDWEDRTIAFGRKKTKVPVLISFGEEAAAILRTLPTAGFLFPSLARINEGHRAKMFIKRLKTVSITGISLHSYRYSWAERAKQAGYPERFAMQALGHNSKAVHRSYSRKALVKVPSLEEFEKKVILLNQKSEPVTQAAASA